MRTDERTVGIELEAAQRNQSIIRWDTRVRRWGSPSPPLEVDVVTTAVVMFAWLWGGAESPREESAADVHSVIVLDTSSSKGSPMVRGNINRAARVELMISLSSWNEGSHERHLLKK